MLPMASCLPAFFRSAFGYGETGFVFAEASARQAFALVESFPPGFAAASAAPH